MHAPRRPASTARAVLLVTGTLLASACGDDSTDSSAGGTDGASSGSTTAAGPTSSTQGPSGAGGDGGAAQTGSGAGDVGGGGVGGSGAGGGVGGPVLEPGDGFAGPTDQPPPVGAGVGVGRTAIAHWDAVPYVTVDGLFRVGVLAYHVAGIDRVELSLDGGPWLAIPAATLNPQTGVEEYWATVDASLVSDGPHEIRAVVHPRVGLAAVLQGTVSSERSSLLFSTNAGGTLPRAVRYVALDGSDEADCLALDSACATIEAALVSASEEGDLDGAEIHLGAGDWSLPETGEAFHNDTRWLTVRSADGVDPETVRVTGVDGPGDGAGLHVKLLRLSDLALVGSINKAVAGGFEDYLWVDRSDVYSTNPDAIAEGDCFSIQGIDVFTGVFVTDVHMDNMCNGPDNATLARDVYAERTAAAHSSGTATVVNYTVEFVYGSTYMPGWPDYHGDVYQMYQRADDIVIYGARTVPDGFISSRGIVGSSTSIHDVAFDHVDLDIDGWVFSFCAPVGGPTIEHMVIQDSRFVGSSNWCGEAPGQPEVDPAGIVDVLIDHSVFDNGSPEQLPQPSDLPGIHYGPQ